MVNRRPRGRPDGGQFAPTDRPEAAGVELRDEVTPGLERPVLRQVLESAARLQQVVPDAVLVGGSAAALWANHRESLDHDHVVADLGQRFDVVLDAIEATDGWVTNRVAPDKLVLGELGGIETGIRQLIRKRPLEVTEVDLGDGGHVRVPTPDETLRIKGYLVVRRNQTRDYLDVVALADRYGIEHAAHVLGRLDYYYGDQRRPEAEGVATQLVRQLSDPRPKDARTTTQLARYKGLVAKWWEWSYVVGACRRLAIEIARQT
jgi:hypothetical protein